MKEIYICPYCARRYTVKAPGNYICDCGIRFNYPEILSSTKQNYAAEAPLFIDSTSTSVKRHIDFHMPSSGASWLKCGSKVDCPYAKASLLMGVLGLAFFGLLSLPAILAGFFAKDMISDSHLNYRGYGMALSGIFLGFAGLFAWGLFLYFKF